MIYKILTAIEGVLLSAAGVMLVVCVVYTMSSPTVRAGFDLVGTSIDGMVSQAVDSIDTEWFSVGDFVGNLFGTRDAATDGSEDGSAVRRGAGELLASDFADPSLGAAYLNWKSVLGDPVGSVLCVDDLGVAVLQGVVGGSPSAERVLSNLGETTLTMLAARGAAYATAASTTAVPAVLPPEVRDRLWDATDAAVAFGNAVQGLASCVRGMQAGSRDASSQLPGIVKSILESLATIQVATTDCEAMLGA